MFLHPHSAETVLVKNTWGIRFKQGFVLDNQESRKKQEKGKGVESCVFVIECLSVGFILDKIENERR